MNYIDIDGCAWHPVGQLRLLKAILGHQPRFRHRWAWWAAKEKKSA